ncbi:Cullin family-domain-containing protein [Roridomyces roridus]|uniref:Cullin family-domain-containing protein n=1 Tax=Roridomyces roridus TaxID=1738132 RepID=A0AAD7FL05_9AGAR|nr:Cullin family-domain-containing protein [Roridomyces roridus]
MAFLQQLLTLPVHSTGFTALPDTLNPEPHKSKVRGNQPTTIHVHGTSPQLAPSRPSTLQLSIRRALARDNARGLSATFEDVYNDCFSVVCVRNEGQSLYETLQGELEQSVTRLSRELLSDKATHGPGDIWLKGFVGGCRWFEGQVALLESLLTYLDQVYVKRAQVASIRQLAFSLFVRTILENPILVATLRTSVTKLLSEERNSRKIFTKTQEIPALVAHLYTHQQYSVFEEFYRDTTWQYYEEESRKTAQEMQNDPKGFFQYVQKRVEEEVERSKKLLPVGSWSIIRDATLKSLLQGKMKWIAEETLGVFLNNKDFENLKVLNEFFSDAEGAKLICGVFKSHIQKTVQSIVQNSAEDETMIEKLLELHALGDSAIKECFLEETAHVTNESTPTSASTSTAPRKRPSQELLYALSDAFSIGFRARRNKPAEMIARHLDKLMRKGQGAMSDAEFDVHLDSALGLYRFTDDKDVFRGFYLRALSKRLLLEKSASHDFEANILKKLKDKYDPEFSMGEEMFTDLRLSRETMTGYYDQLDKHVEQKKLSSEEADEMRKLSVMVLKQGAWPYSHQENAPLLPPNMQRQLDAFTDYYKSKHNGRKLFHQPNISTVTLTGRFKAGTKELSVSLYQAMILILFNRSVELSLSEIRGETGLDDALLRLTLQSLACGKKRVITKVPLGRDVKDGDSFKFNDGFVDPRAKVHINSIQVKVTAEESKQTQTAIDGERGASLDAAIVRIMKAKKEMKYEHLLNAVVDAVKNHFVPDVKHIKQRIDKLMDDYVERDKEKPETLVYIA